MFKYYLLMFHQDGTLIPVLFLRKVSVRKSRPRSPWHGRVTKIFSGINPAINLSLSAPKHCLKQFSGENYLGGRFLPDEIKKEFNLSLPDYPDQEQIVKFDKTQIDFSAE